MYINYIYKCAAKMGGGVCIYINYKCAAKMGGGLGWGLGGNRQNLTLNVATAFCVAALAMDT